MSNTGSMAMGVRVTEGEGNLPKLVLTSAAGRCVLLLCPFVIFKTQLIDEMNLENGSSALAGNVEISAVKSSNRVSFVIFMCVCVELNM